MPLVAVDALGVLDAGAAELVGEALGRPVVTGGDDVPVADDDGISLEVYILDSKGDAFVEAQAGAV